MLELNKLNQIRRLRKGLLLSFILLLVSIVLFYSTPWPRPVREYIVIIAVAVYGFSTLLTVFSRCPRCGGLFHNVLGFNNPLSRYCSNCGLPLNADDD